MTSHSSGRQATFLREDRGERFVDFSHVVEQSSYTDSLYFGGPEPDGSRNDFRGARNSL